LKKVPALQEIGGRGNLQDNWGRVKHYDETIVLALSCLEVEEKKGSSVAKLSFCLFH